MQYQPLYKVYYQSQQLHQELFEKRISSESTIHLPFNIKDCPAFVISTNEMLSKITAILNEDKELSILEQRVPEIAKKQFAMQSLVDEIKLSNDIEGVHSTRKEIAAVLHIVDTAKPNQRFAGLIKKFMLLMEKQEIPLNTCEDIRKLYDETFLNDVIKDDPDNVPDGMYFRKQAVKVYSGTQKELHAGVMPEKSINELMTIGLNLLQSNEIDPLITLSIFHYLFGYVHPFYDGNGRMSRFISSYLLSRRLHYLTAFGLSAAIKQNRKRYYKAFDIANDPKNCGDLTPFVLDFLDFILCDITDTKSSLESKMEKMHHFHKPIDMLVWGDKDLKRLLHVLLQQTLFGIQGLSIRQLAEILRYKENTVRRYLNNFDSHYLRINKSHRQYLYELNLDALEELNLPTK